MSTSMEQIIDVLEGPFDLLCDDCLSQMAEVRPRQQVNMICRSLASAGKLIRQKASCPECSNKKILNKLVTREKVRLSDPSKDGTIQEASFRYLSELREQAAKLDSIRWEMITMCRQLECEKTEERRSLLDRFSKLESKGILPIDICIVMRMINAMRNAVLYQGCALNRGAQELIHKAHQYAFSWWQSQHHS